MNTKAPVSLSATYSYDIWAILIIPRTDEEERVANATSVSRQRRHRGMRSDAPVVLQFRFMIL